jgi:L-rhamnose mutarotase
MKRYAFVMRVKPGAEEEYRRRHREVFPDLLQAISRVGIREYSIFMLENTLFAYLQVADYHDVDAVMGELAQDPANIRWQEYMAPIMETWESGGIAKVVPEVFYRE